VGFLRGREADLLAHAGRFFLGCRVAFLGRLSLNRIFCLNDSLQHVLRKSQKYEI